MLTENLANQSGAALNPELDEQQRRERSSVAFGAQAMNLDVDMMSDSEDGDDLPASKSASGK